MTRYLLLLTMLLPALCQAADVEFHMIRFFDPNPVAAQRVKSADELGNYLKKSQAAAKQELKSFDLPSGGGFLVLAIRADGRTNAWLDMVEPVPEKVATAVVQAVRKIPAFKVKSGTLLVALDLTINGGFIPENVSPYPQEWLDYASNCKACGELDAETIVNKIWL
jgi:hypothetical protein